MNYSIIRYTLLKVLAAEGCLMLLPVLVSVIYQEKQGIIYAIVAVLSIVLGELCTRKKPKKIHCLQKRVYLL